MKTAVWRAVEAAWTQQAGRLFLWLPVALGAGARMTFLYRDATDYEDPNGNSLVTRATLFVRHVGEYRQNRRADPATILKELLASAAPRP